MITSARELASRYFSGHTVPSSKSSRRIQVSRVLYDLSRGAENVMSRLLSHRDDTSSSLLPPSLPFFFLSSASSFFVPARFSLLFPNCDVGLSYPAVTGPSTARALYPPRHFTMVQRPRSDAPLRPSPSHPHMRRRVNFLQIGILLQFASSSIILAPPRSLLRLVLALASSFCSCHTAIRPPLVSRVLC